jgi:hypothetical protein
VPAVTMLITCLLRGCQALAMNLNNCQTHMLDACQSVDSRHTPQNLAQTMRQER